MKLQQNQKDVTCQCCGGKNFSVFHTDKNVTIFSCSHCRQSLTLEKGTYEFVKSCYTCDNQGKACPNSYYTLCLGQTKENSDNAPEYRKYIPIVL